MESRAGLRDWLAACDAELPEGARAEWILCACGGASEADVRARQRTSARLGLHLAPQGPLWAELIERWFQPDPGRRP